MLTDQQRAEGWVEHDGGPCPVDGSQRVELLFRGAKAIPSAAYWAAAFDWSYDRGSPSVDIIAYRKEPQP